jgi:hypothetical protein
MTNSLDLADLVSVSAPFEIRFSFSRIAAAERLPTSGHDRHALVLALNPHRAYGYGFDKEAV